MISSGKLFLFFAVAFCVIEGIASRPRLDANYLENVRFELTRKCTGVERDITKDTLNIRHKVNKESAKLLKKATKAGSAQCVEEARAQAEDQLEEKSQEAMECVSQLKDTLDSELGSEAELGAVLAFRNDFKNKLNACKKTAKVEFKTVQNSFSTAGKSCTI